MVANMMIDGRQKATVPEEEKIIKRTRKLQKNYVAEYLQMKMELIIIAE